MAKSHTESETQRIHEERDGGRQFLLHPSDDDVFIRTGKQVIEACRLGISIDLWIEEFSSMLARVAEWAAGQATVRSCYCSPQGHRILIVLAPRSAQFDFDLADRAVELCSELQKYNIGAVEVRQVPWDEMDRFMEPQSARLIYGEKFEPHPTVET